MFQSVSDCVDYLDSQLPCLVEEKGKLNDDLVE